MKTKHDQNRTSPEVVLKAWMIGVVLAVMIGTMGVCPVLSANMITDGDFSTDPLAEGATGWSIYPPPALGGTATYEWNSTGKYETMTYTAGDTNWFLASFNLVPEIDDQGYDFSADINCYNAHPTQAMAAELWWLNASDAQVGVVNLIPQQGATADWTTFSAHLDGAPATAVKGLILFQGRWYGAMAIDDVSFTATGAVPEPMSLALLAAGFMGGLLRRKK